MTYSLVAHHASMVFDLQRNRAYAEQIERCVTPDSVVLDLGAGLGVLGLLAARAGARRVYLVDPEPVVNLAMDIARANGLADRVVVLQGRIEDIELPERVDLILSVFTGVLLYSEDLLPSLFHARDRYLKPGGTLLPDRAELHLAPCHAPARFEEHVNRWSQPVLALDFSPARSIAHHEILWIPRREFEGVSLLAGGQMAGEIDLATASRADCDAQARFTVGTAGLCHGLACWTRFRLGSTWHSTAPGERTHWPLAILPLDPPLPLDVGDPVEASLTRPERGDWTWRMTAPAGRQRHSTFLASLESPRALRRLAADARPGLSRQGQWTRAALDALDRGASVGETIDRLCALAPEHPRDGMERLVRRLVGRHGG